MLLDVKNLAVDFATPKGILQAVRGIDFELNEGEVLGIVGESGSGKSVTAHTLLKLIPGNGSIRSGSIEYRGESVLEFSEEELRRFRGGQIGIIFQEPARSFDPIYSIGRTMRESILAHHPDLSSQEGEEKSIELLREVQVPRAEERLSNFPHQFSGGLLQRIMIALALSSDPEILIADEPTTALDVTIQSQIIQLLLDLKERRGISIIFISHNLALIGSVADRIIVMYSGLILESGKVEEVLQRPHHPYTRALLDSILTFGDHYSDRSLRVVAGTIPDPHNPDPGCPFAPRCPMASESCHLSVPDIKSEGTDHRCLFSGVKESFANNTAAALSDPEQLEAGGQQ